ncbi:unnamed protein product, partial [Didymodactylos carnosus]
RAQSEDEENLVPGSYLLPMADVDFSVRLRGYRRMTYLNRYKSNDLLPTTSSLQMTPERLLTRDTVKERLHVDVQGRRHRGCSLVPHSGCSVSRELSVPAAPSSQLQQTISSSSYNNFYGPYGRTSESPAHQYGLSSRYGSVSRSSPYRGMSIPREFQAQGFTQEQRSTKGEGFAAVFKEKLTDSSFLIGGTVILRCKVQGNPFPKIFWYRNDEFIIEDDRIQFAQGEDGLCTLTINYAKASDIGIYRCVARNVYGDATCKARLLIGDVPDRPQRPLVVDISSNEAYLIWSAPSYDGNNDIAGYRVDYKAREDIKWTISTFTIEESAIIKDLKSNTNYRFRVSCINKIGISAYSWGSEEIKTLEDGTEPLKKIDRRSAYRLLEHQHRIDQKSLKTVSEFLQPELSKPKTLGEKTVLKRDQNPWDLYKMIEELNSYDNSCCIRCAERATESVRIVKVVDLTNIAQSHSNAYVPEEFDLLNQIDHDHIIKMIDGFMWKNSFVLTMDNYLEICDYICLRHKYTEELIVRILRQLLDAVQYLHFHGIVHLNINPSSVVNENQLSLNVKLTDFSCATQLATPQGHNVTNSINPNNEYSAPEILNDEATGVQADVWSIGALTATLLSGFSPFAGVYDDDTNQNVTFVRWNTNEFYDDVTQEAVIFVQQCLKKSPNNRLIIPECLEHKWLSLNTISTNRREMAIFLTEKLNRFVNDFRQRCRSKTKIQRETIEEISKR